MPGGRLPPPLSSLCWCGANLRITAARGMAAALRRHVRRFPYFHVLPTGGRTFFVRHYLYRACRFRLRAIPCQPSLALSASVGLPPTCSYTPTHTCVYHRFIELTYTFTRRGLWRCNVAISRRANRLNRNRAHFSRGCATSAHIGHLIPVCIVLRCRRPGTALYAHANNND